ncbi:uncharacterized protein CTHT_0008070 [Thermochaetoides thermophila DSM 1495]|uniref:RING-type domain-containing protein n=1 Tax=Chaetomium thermophilum (strain DSM 1495 / CBS 144.50 / IMI 039719) TaxID=759272 RepID=G0RZY5_CHATD|nr:hypothetical protein CTHT_0008070 [Thermochaetoides thermophila DSM 1495]EGS23146.1 hypothetical protein CTHT_0008070 [Thermochaetoides thermophila DSM 1495]
MGRRGGPSYNGRRAADRPEFGDINTGGSVVNSTLARQGTESEGGSSSVSNGASITRLNSGEDEERTDLSVVGGSNAAGTIGQTEPADGGATDEGSAQVDDGTGSAQASQTDHSSANATVDGDAGRQDSVSQERNSVVDGTGPALLSTQGSNAVQAGIPAVNDDTSSVQTNNDSNGNQRRIDNTQTDRNVHSNGSPDFSALVMEMLQAIVGRLDIIIDKMDNIQSNTANSNATSGAIAVADNANTNSNDSNVIRSEGSDVGVGSADQGNNGRTRSENETILVTENTNAGENPLNNYRTEQQRVVDDRETVRNVNINNNDESGEVIVHELAVVSDAIVVIEEDDTTANQSAGTSNERGVASVEIEIIADRESDGNTVSQQTRGNNTVGSDNNRSASNRGSSSGGSRGRNRRRNYNRGNASGDNAASSVAASSNGRENTNSIDSNHEIPLRETIEQVLLDDVIISSFDDLGDNGTSSNSRGNTGVSNNFRTVLGLNDNSAISVNTADLHRANSGYGSSVSGSRDSTNNMIVRIRNLDENLAGSSPSNERTVNTNGSTTDNRIPAATSISGNSRGNRGAEGPPLGEQGVVEEVAREAAMLLVPGAPPDNRTGESENNTPGTSNDTRNASTAPRRSTRRRVITRRSEPESRPQAETQPQTQAPTLPQPLTGDPSSRKQESLFPRIVAALDRVSTNASTAGSSSSSSSSSSLDNNSLPYASCPICQTTQLSILDVPLLPPSHPDLINLPDLSRGVVLYCGHMVCTPCWEVYAQQHQENAPTIDRGNRANTPPIRCPVCRTDLCHTWCKCPLPVWQMPPSLEDPSVSAEERRRLVERFAWEPAEHRWSKEIVTAQLLPEGGRIPAFCGPCSDELDRAWHVDMGFGAASRELASLTWRESSSETTRWPFQDDDDSSSGIFESSGW